MAVSPPDYVQNPMADPRVLTLLDGLKAWPGPLLNSHKSARQLFHHLVFLADIGLSTGTPEINDICTKLLASFGQDGIPTLNMNIGEGHGGNGEPVAAWALCDAPNTLYGLAKLGCTDQRIPAAVDRLAGYCQPNGFGCVVSASLGSWHGPGRKQDPCPYATLIMLKLLLLYGDRYSSAIAYSAGSLLDLWADSRSRHPYIFYMGTDFRKLKLPFIWYDILHVCEVLSQVPGLASDSRLQEMFALIKTKETADAYIPESVYQPFKDWDFGQKKAVSSYMAWRINIIEERLKS
ncbi:MAG: hypothetical protein KKI09_15980 [Spirochaetes bacterium]|nr:hypothetical protein [Spirochaetota bacterium]MBU0956922.1 hypothetical protein [Spirochaetota bacterium]